MNAMVFSPLEDYEKTLKNTHLHCTQQRFAQLTAQSGVNIEENRSTVKAYDAQAAKAAAQQKKVSRLKLLRVLVIIGAVLCAIAAIWGFMNTPALGVVFALGAIGLLLVMLLVLNPKIKHQAKILVEENTRAQKLLAQAQEQMAPLNALLASEDGLPLLEETLPLLKFNPNYSFEQESEMVRAFDFPAYEVERQSVLDTLCGTYNGNPFLFEKYRVCTMGTETYHGSLVIHWTEHYTDSKGNRRSRTRSQTLHASVTKPKPFYTTETLLYYGAQGSPDLTFSRQNLHHEDKSERELKATIRKGEKKLREKEEDALEENKSFTGMANTQFEVLFGALDRDNETQFRLLFTPLAQTNMVDLILSETGYGDDFDFFKRRRMNTIVSEHSQNRPLRLNAKSLSSHSYDLCMENYIRENTEYFRSIYFDLAPILAIPVYQERPVQFLEPLPPGNPWCSPREYEVLANAMGNGLSHPKSKTESIFKTRHTCTADGVDTVSVTAHSYDAIPHIDSVPVLGGDGQVHLVPVPWQEYKPLENSCRMTVSQQPQETPGSDYTVSRHRLYACAFPDGKNKS